jgi:hypothetical protein
MKGSIAFIRQVPDSNVGAVTGFIIEYFVLSISIQADARIIS